MQLDLRLLEIFCRVYEERSFSRAGEKLWISQPTVSGHIKNLEEALEVKLFERLPREVVPTQAARIIYRHGEIILKQRQIAMQDLMAFLNRLEGSLSLAASTIPGEYLLPQVLVAFRAQFPKVDVRLTISDSKEVCDQVVKGKVELGCAGAQLDILGLKYHHFASDSLVLVVPCNSRWRAVTTISVEDLRREPFLARESGSGTRLSFEKQIGRNLDEFNVQAVLSSTNAVKEGVKAGLGVSVLSLLAVQTEMAHGVLKTVRIENCETLRRDFFAVFNKRLTLSPIAKSFLDALESQAEELGLSA